MARASPLAAAAACAALAASAGVARAISIPIGTEFGCGPFCFTNIAQGLRTWVNPANTSENVAVDENGWPLGDSETVLFDDRAVPAWNPPLDDPWGWQSPLNGTYLMNFTGKGTVAPVAGQGAFTVSNCTFDAPTFTTSCEVTLPPGSPNLIVLSITATQRNATAPVGSGFTNMRVMRPGHWDDGPWTPSPEMLSLLGANGTQVFPTHMRFMGITGTNNQAGYYGDEGHHYLDFSMRCLPTDALIPNNLRPGCWGIPWEQVIVFSQATGKGVWINAPVSATVSYPVNTSSYVYEWATLMKNGNSFTGDQGLPAGVPIYLEHSNEVWNFGFSQYIWNKLAAIDECNVTAHPTAPPCDWANDGSKDEEVWAQRRHIGKVYQIAQTYAAVFGQDAMLTQIRPIYADWSIFPDRYNSTLSWFNATYGPPKNFLYAMAITGYYGKQPFDNSTIDDIYFGYMNSTDNQYASRRQMVEIANFWGLKVVGYEAGPGWTVGTTTGVGNTILAQRFYNMREVVKYDILSWADAGAQEYNAFALTGLYSRYGQWGFTEHMFNASTPRYCGLLDLTTPEGGELPKGCQGW